jgi:hypothetical protein
VSVEDASDDIYDWEANLERMFAKADRDREAETRLRRLRALQEPTARRRAYPLDVGWQRGTSAPLCARLPRWLEEQIRRELDGLGVTVSTGLRQILEEGWWCVVIPRSSIAGPTSFGWRR